jgi:serine/threonine protein kinase
MIGTNISHYKILEKLGEGGMGVVYKAQDTTLDRLVALKFLPAHLSASEADKARFIQEAKAAATLNHPNICTIYGIEQAEGKDFISMEFVDGQTLQQKKANLSMKQALEIGIQVADGLAAAHEKGIVHRDIKPENIMIRKDGIAQVMDFGLAKLRGASRLTKEGSTVGTAGYMSPEQVQGQDADHRSDIFSLGVLLYEMIAGRIPFKGVHETAIAYEIVNVDSPPMSSIKPEIPSELDAIVLECLEKDPNERAQSAKQVGIDLKRYKRESSRERVSRITAARPAMSRASSSPEQLGREQSSLPASEGLLSRGRLPWIVAALGLAGMATFAALYFVRPSTNKAIVRSSMLPPSNSGYSSFMGGGHLALSPDGLKLAFVAMDSSGKNNLWVRALNSLTALPLPGTDGAVFPFWSPDNRFIGFFSSTKMKKIEASGGPPSSICDVADPRGATWGEDGIIVFAPNWLGGVYQVSAAGGVPAPLTKLNADRREQTHRWPWFLPDGKHFLYFSRSGTGGTERGEDAVYVSSLDGKVNNRLFSASSSVAYASGYILFVRQSAVMAQPFNNGSLELMGEAFPIAEQVGYDIDFNRGHFAVSQNGVFAFRTGASTSGSELLWFDRAGKKVGNIGDPGLNGGGQLSRDEKKFAVSLFDAQSRNRDIWTYELSRGGVRTRFTFGTGVEDYAVWSPDGSRIIYCSDKKGHLDIYQKAFNGAGGEELLLESESDKYTTDVSSDGRFLLYYTAGDPKTKTDVWILPLVGERKPIPLLQTEFEEYDAQFSRDGKWISYVSNESGRYEVYVRPFAGSGALPAGKWQISTAGVAGTIIGAARWRGDGKELYYWSEDQKLMAAEVKTAGSSLEVGAVKPLFDVKSKSVAFVAAVSADGQRFLLASAMGHSSTPLTLVLNWDEELKKK